MKLREFAQPTQLEEGINDPGIFKAVFMAGPPGAGKNHVISALGLNAAGLKLMDIDDTLYYLFKSRNALDRLKTITDADYEAVRKTEQARQSMMRRNMLGLTINTTGREPERIQELKNELEESGYSTFMVFVGVDHSVASSRIENRRKFATDPRDTRPVTKPYFDAAHESSMKSATYYAMLFGTNFAYVENNVPTHNRPIAEEDDLVEGPVEDFDAGLKDASKKVSRFLKSPLTPTALAIVDATRPKNH